MNTNTLKLAALPLAASIVLMLASLAVFAVKGLNYGVDFKGGSLIELQAKSGQADPADVRARLNELNLGEVQVQQVGGSDTLLVRIGTQEGGDNAEQTVVTKVRGERSGCRPYSRTNSTTPIAIGSRPANGSS